MVESDPADLEERIGGVPGGELSFERGRTLSTKGPDVDEGPWPGSNCMDLGRARAGGTGSASVLMLELEAITGSGSF